MLIKHQFMVDITIVTIVNGIINQLITGGYHLVSGSNPWIWSKVQAPPQILFIFSVGKPIRNLPWLGIVYSTHRNGDGWGWFIIGFTKFLTIQCLSLTHTHIIYISVNHTRHYTTLLHTNHGNCKGTLPKWPNFSAWRIKIIPMHQTFNLSEGIAHMYLD